VRFRNDDDPGDSPGGEFVEYRLNDGGPGGNRRIHERRFDPFKVIKAIDLALVQIEQHLRADHGMPCRFVGPQQGSIPHHVRPPTNSMLSTRIIASCPSLDWLSSFSFLPAGVLS